MAGRSREDLTAEDVLRLLDDPDEPIMAGSDDEEILWDEGMFTRNNAITHKMFYLDEILNPVDTTETPQVHPHVIPHPSQLQQPPLPPTQAVLPVLTPHTNQLLAP